MCVLFVRLGIFLFFCSMLLWCCLRRWDIICNVSALNLPSANWSYLTFRQSIDCSFPASSSADKKKASEQTVLEIQGHAELGTKVFLSEEKHKSGQFYKRFWLEKENIEHLKSFLWLPANVRQRLNVRGKTWQWIILQTFGEIDFVLLAVFPFAIFEVLFFRGARFETEVSECGVLLDDECWSLHSPRAQVSQVGVDVNGECMSMFLGTKKLFSYGLVAFQAQRFVSE